MSRRFGGYVFVYVRAGLHRREKQEKDDLFP